MATKAKKRAVEKDHEDDQSVVSQLEASVIGDVDDDESLFQIQDIDLLQNHGIVSLVHVITW